jgi:hypothetical protein
MVPIYFPNSKMTFEVFGFTNIKPKNPKNPIKVLSRKTGLAILMVAAIPPINNAKRMNSIR